MDILTTISHFSNHRTCTGWMSEPRHAEEVAQSICHATSIGLKVCVMGSQNSVSDIFLGSGQMHISLRQMNKIISIDYFRAEICVESGTLISDILAVVMPAGFYLSGLSGSPTDTIGGMVSANSHGKDSWVHGNFGNNVVEVQIIDYTGKEHVVNHKDERMKAIIGGLGALGVVTAVTLRLKKLPSEILNVTKQKTELGSFSTLDGAGVDYVHAWMDIYSEHLNTIIFKAAFDRVPVHASPQYFSTAGSWKSPPRIFWRVAGLFWNPRTYFLTNKLYHFLQKEKITYKAFTIDFLYPLRNITGMKNVFKKASFYELHTLFPTTLFSAASIELQALIRSRNINPNMSGIKWHVPDHFFLSFSGAGISINNVFDADLINSNAGQKFLARYIQIVNDHQGKFYLAKFPYLSNDDLKRSYPEFNKWVHLKQSMDPFNVFSSDRIATLVGAD